MSRIEAVVGQICSTRRYTESLLDDLSPQDWFRMPSEGVTHVAWQVGHLAVAEYYLALQRIRGRRQEDGQLFSDEFMKLFGKGSTPKAGAEPYPSPDEIRQVFDGVHRQVVAEVSGLPDGVWDESTAPPEPHVFYEIGGAALLPSTRNAPCGADRPAETAVGKRALKMIAEGSG